jgi:hypothetical protein
LDRLRKSLNDKIEVASLINTINEEKGEKGVKMDEYQKELLESIILRLSDEDTVISV